MCVTGCAYATECEFDSAISTYCYMMQNYTDSYVEKYLNKCECVRALERYRAAKISFERSMFYCCYTTKIWRFRQQDGDKSHFTLKYREI